jgi:hypothetical protein
MIAAVVVGFLLPLCTGLLLTRPAFAPTQRVWSGRFLRLSTAFGLGVGLHATGFFLALLVFDGTLAGTAVFDTLVLLLAAGWSIGNPVCEDQVPNGMSHRSTTLQLGLAILLVLLIVVSILAFVLASIEEPHGGWDAWAIWNLRARFLARAGAGWSAAFSDNMQHTDYPLLVPGAIARIWKYAPPGESQLFPILLVFLFALSTVGLTCGALGLLRSRSHALLAGICLTPVLLNEAAYQYADVQVGFYILLSLVLFAWHDRIGGGEWRLVALAGLAAALAAWTKNEGLLFLLAIVAGRVVRYRRDQIWPWPFLAGAAPVLIALAYFKLTLAPRNDLLPHLEWSRLIDPARYGELAGAVAKELSSSRELVLAALLPIGVYLLLLGRSAKRDLPILPWFVTLATSATALMILYLVAPRELEWFVANSVDRLSLQLYPLVLFVAFLWAASPEERLSL